MNSSTAIKKCAHLWRIESPDGPTSKGVCKKCGEKREFQNYPEHDLGETNAGIYTPRKDPIYWNEESYKTKG